MQIAEGIIGVGEGDVIGFGEGVEFAVGGVGIMGCFSTGFCLRSFSVERIIGVSDCMGRCVSTKNGGLFKGFVADFVILVASEGYGVLIALFFKGEELV